MKVKLVGGPFNGQEREVGEGCNHYTETVGLECGRTHHYRRDESIPTMHWKGTNDYPKPHTTRSICDSCDRNALLKVSDNLRELLISRVAEVKKLSRERDALLEETKDMQLQINAMATLIKECDRCLHSEVCMNKELHLMETCGDFFQAP